MNLQNGRVQLTLDDKTGAIIGLKDLVKAREYAGQGVSPTPFRIATTGEMETAAYRVEMRASENGCTLSWALQGAALKADITLLDDGVAFRATLQNDADTCIKAFEYPILSGMPDYGMNGYLAHAYATGVLLRDPAAYVPATGALRYAPYPEAFSGASMQFFTYYEAGQGGLFFAALDGDGHQKWLNVYTENGALAASHMAGFENTVPGSAIAMQYDFVIRFTEGNGWQEAAELYKPWALAQRWSRRGPARERTDKADWLLEKVGLCTFGINAGHDRTAWLCQYREDIGTPAFHVLGPDWTNTPQTFGSGVPGDMEDWVPTRFNRENLQQIRENGDYCAPFEFDFMVAMDKSNPEKLRPHLQRFPKPTFSHDAYEFNMLCPADPFTKDFHREKNLTMLREGGVDAMYYDISCNNLIKICMSEDHPHHPGGGKEITDAYLDVYQDTQSALCEEAGAYIPLGTEMMNETCLANLDYYQARAWAQPSSTLETYPFREQMRDGRARMIPLFDYVYHELGIVRMDGWGKLVDVTGDYFHHIVAMVYLWGGLYEINHEYSPMEAIGGVENESSEHYFHFDPQGHAYSPERAAYLGLFAKARVGAANRYWAYGKMTVQPEMDIPEVQADWYHYNHNQKDTSYKAGGTLTVPAVVTSAYEDGEGGYALFLANAGADAQTLSIPLDARALRLTGGDRAIHLTAFGADAPTTSDLGMLRAGMGQTVQVTLQPRSLCMLEIK